MFGWSYGGYAALVASQRDPQLYQCAIAGAAVADPAKSYCDRRNPGSPKALDEWAKRRGMIGINPIADVAKTNIPVMMVHGDVDHRVEYWHLKDYQSAMRNLDKAGLVIVGEDDTNYDGSGGGGQKGAAPGKAVKFVTLEGAGHFYNTLMYDHQTKLYTEMLDFLKNDCGPGGL